VPVAEKRTKAYPMNVVTFARRLHEQNGWEAGRIRKALIARGHSPSHNTVLCWIDEDYADMRRERNKLEHRRRRGGLRSKPRHTPWGCRLTRMEELRAAGLSYGAVAKVMELDFEVTLTRDQSERILKGMVSGRTIRRLLWPKEAT
jgi:hypothetical protein